MGRLVARAWRSVEGHSRGGCPLAPRRVALWAIAGATGLFACAVGEPLPSEALVVRHADGGTATPHELAAEGDPRATAAHVVAPGDPNADVVDGAFHAVVDGRERDLVDDVLVAYRVNAGVLAIDAYDTEDGAHPLELSLAVPSLTPGTYACTTGDAAHPWVLFHDPARGYYASESASGGAPSCTLTLEAVGEVGGRVRVHVEAKLARTTGDAAFADLVADADLPRGPDAM